MGGLAIAQQRASGLIGSELVFAHGACCQERAVCCLSEAFGLLRLSVVENPAAQEGKPMQEKQPVQAGQDSETLAACGLLHHAGTKADNAVTCEEHRHESYPSPIKFLA